MTEKVFLMAKNGHKIRSASDEACQVSELCGAAWRIMADYDVANALYIDRSLARRNLAVPVCRAILSNVANIIGR